MKDKLILSAYGSHNAAISMYYKGQYHVVEVERWLNYKNIGLSNYMPVRNMQLVFDQITEWLLNKTDRSDVDVFLTDYLPHIVPKFNYKEKIGFEHHMGHAATAFYQSPYQKSLVFTFDGGGDGAYFNVYMADRTKGIELIDKFNQDLGFPYMILSDNLKDIKKESLTIANLVYAGKLMGLCSYGKVHEEWLPYFDAFYDKFNYFGNAFIGGAEARYTAITELMSQIGVQDFDFEETRLEGQIAWDIAATTQVAFERQFFKYAQKYLDMYPDLPVCLAGGCALNVLLNTKLLNQRKGNVFVPPNSNDCGISVGGLLWYQRPQHQVDLTYSGLPIMDETELGIYLEDHKFDVVDNVSIKELAAYLAKNYIVGFIQGNAEHGARALGNRSILCNPIGNMKDVINDKVKHREWYRPFAPMVRLEDVDKYFDGFIGESRHMTFVATVKEEWRDKLPAITHEDNTGRIQTLTRQQNEKIYDLITEFETFAGHGVLLNTSFNINGQPILSRYGDALKLLETSEMDAVYLADKQILVFKRNESASFTKSLEKTDGMAPLLLDTTVNVMVFPETQEELIEKYIPNLIRLSKSVDFLTLVTTEQYAAIISRSITSPNVRYHYINDNRLYYAHVIEKAKDIYPVFKTNKIHYFSKFITILWAKEVLRDNIFGTKYHLFIDPSLFDDTFSYDYVRDISILSTAAKIDENKILVSALKTNKDSSIPDEYLIKKYEKLPEMFPLPAIIAGNVEAIEWLSSNYEGMILWHGQQRLITKASDYLLASAAEYTHMYKFLSVEKNDN